jgi:hypothetical protein
MGESEKRGPLKFKEPEKSATKYIYELSIPGHTYRIETSFEAPFRRGGPPPTTTGQLETLLFKMAVRGKVYEKIGDEWKEIGRMDMMENYRRYLMATADEEIKLGLDFRDVTKEVAKEEEFLKATPKKR